MGRVEISGDDPYVAEVLAREIAGRIRGKNGQMWQELFTTYGAIYGVTIAIVKKATIKGKFNLPEPFSPYPVVKDVPDMICGGEHEWETAEGDETFEARCVKCGLFYRFEVYD